MSRLESLGPYQHYVYAIGAADQHFVKIGCTMDPQRRLQFIQVTSPFAMEILWFSEGGLDLEAGLHQHFADRRIRGEWFEFHGDAVKLISEACKQIQPEEELLASFVNAAPVRRRYLSRQRAKRPGGFGPG